MTSKVAGGNDGDGPSQPVLGPGSDRTVVLPGGPPVAASVLPAVRAVGTAPKRTPVAGIRTRERAAARPPTAATAIEGTQMLGGIAADARTQAVASADVVDVPAAANGGTQAKRKRPDSRHPLSFEDTQRIGRFELIREIARGGMGQVFLARDTKLGRKVAIKFLLHDDPNFVSRFIVEARATARCTHENIVTIFEVGEHQGLPFMVLEYLEGKTLSQLLEQRPTPRGFAELMVPVVRALERAHEHGIVHRDLKPSNIFVTDRGSVKVLDFGVAKCFDNPAEPIDHIASAALDGVEPTSEHTYVTFSGNGSLVGTLPYMSPEQWGADVVDFASDLWAVGIMFWRALTSVHPAGTMSPDRMRERMLDLDTPLPSLHVRDPSIPRELSLIVDCCLAKHKSARYPSATELLADLQAYLAPKELRAAEDVSPYRGLAAFSEGDAKFFFGRSAEVRTAVAQLDFWPLLAVIGPSGVGKSSFVHAGLVPAVRATSGHWETRVLRPGRSPLTSLANVLLDDAVDAGQVTDIMSQLGDAPGLFGEALRREAMRKRQKVLIVVDQLEELFTLSEDDEVRKHFLAALLAAADDPSSPVRVVLSMRADFLDRLAVHKYFLAELSRGLFFLSAPDADNLRETLVRPAELAGYQFEDDSIVDDMMQKATSRGALPLLQFAAQRLWDSRDRNRKLLTRAAYDAMGGVGGAFARHADEVASAVPANSQQLLRAVMTRLVTLERTRAVVDHAELLGLSNDREEIERIIDQLVRARLIVLHTDQESQSATVEIVHEVLITEWPTLVRWLEDNQSLQGFMHELRQAARQWQTRGRSSDLVWRGATAHEAIGITNRHILDLTSTERDFIAAVRLQASRGKRRRVLSLAAAFILLALVIAGSAIAFIRISAAEKNAEKDAAAARQANGLVAQQLKDVQDAQAKKEAADRVAETERQKAISAGKAVQETKEDLVRTNADLKKALDEAKTAVDEAKKSADEAKTEKLKAQELAKTAAAKAEEARKAQQEAIASAKETARLLGLQKAENERLEKNAHDIARTLKP